MRLARSNLIALPLYLGFVGRGLGGGGLTLGSGGASGHTGAGGPVETVGTTSRFAASLATQTVTTFVGKT
jgi:hypothetical protein